MWVNGHWAGHVGVTDFWFRFSAESPTLLSVAHTVPAEYVTSLSVSAESEISTFGRPLFAKYCRLPVSSCYKAWLQIIKTLVTLCHYYATSPIQDCQSTPHMSQNLFAEGKTPVEESAIFATLWPLWPWPWIRAYGISFWITHQPLPTYQILFNRENICGWTERHQDQLH